MAVAVHILEAVFIFSCSSSTSCPRRRRSSSSSSGSSGKCSVAMVKSSWY